MSFHEQVAPANLGRRVSRPSGLRVQRQCTCGSHTDGGECDGCRKKRLLQRSGRDGIGFSMPATYPGVPARNAGVRAADDALATRQALGPGRPLDGGVRSRMEKTFGYSFARVRIHTDATADRLSMRENARAFTVGGDVAFAAGEYRPGTPAGDALIAHELAHVVQQNGATNPATEPAGGASQVALERDADSATVGAVAALMQGERTAAAALAPSARPRLSSGLRLQRCGAGTQAARTRAGAPSANGLSCSGVASAAPEGAAAEEGEGSGGRLDARARGIIGIAQDASQPIEQRAVAVVTLIVCQYFAADAEKVNSIRYEADERGLSVTTARIGSTIRGDLHVGSYFVEHTTRHHFARRVLQVRHELQHVEQWRSGMTGPATADEREFLAFHREALAEALPGTGRMQHGTRVNLIDGALGRYHCLSAEKQEEYRGERDELLERRRVHERASGGEATAPPTTCRRS